MAVTLSALWLNDALDPSDAIEIPYLGDSYQVADTLGGGIEDDYASGRSRLWSDARDITTASVSLERAPAATLAWLRSHRGRVVCVRDWRGRKFYAGFHVVQAAVSTMPAGYLGGDDTAAVEFRSVTFSEAV